MEPENRFPRSVYREGTDPDPRFTLANERTFLAWIRTSLGLIAAGVAVQAFAVELDPRLRLVVAVMLIVAGIATPLQAWSGWMRTERAMRMSRPLPAPLLALPVAIAIVVAAVVVLLAVVLPR